MAVNKFKPHVLVIPEDDKDRQIAKKLSENQAFAFRFPARRSMRRIMLT